jgi:hypothetical protein
MTPPAGWSFAGNQPLRLLPDLLGLPTRYAAVLVTVSMMTAIQFHYLYAGAFGWEIMAKNLTLPRRLLP